MMITNIFLHLDDDLTREKKERVCLCYNLLYYT